MNELVIVTVFSVAVVCVCADASTCRNRETCSQFLTWFFHVRSTEYVRGVPHRHADAHYNRVNFELMTKKRILILSLSSLFDIQRIC